MDGVRGYWDGKKLLSKQGIRIPTPEWFTTGLPQVPLDGELWMGRGTSFEEVLPILKNPKHACWKRLNTVCSICLLPEEDSKTG